MQDTSSGAARCGISSHLDDRVAGSTRRIETDKFHGQWIAIVQGVTACDGPEPRARGDCDGHLGSARNGRFLRRRRTSQWIVKICRAVRTLRIKFEDGGCRRWRLDGRITTSRRGVRAVRTKVSLYHRIPGKTPESLGARPTHTEIDRDWSDIIITNIDLVCGA
jgi:hypothetical protein